MFAEDSDVVRIVAGDNVREGAHGKGLSFAIPLLIQPSGGIFAKSEIVARRTLRNSSIWAAQEILSASAVDAAMS